MTGPFLSIDPGLSGTGWAEWSGPGKLTAAGVIYPNSETSDIWSEKAENITDRLLMATKRFGKRTVHNVYIEMPQQMTNIRGLAAQGGAVYKLAFLVGYIARAYYPASVHPVLVSEWKGQLPKNVVEHRIIKKLGTDLCAKLNIRTHAWDAVGIGLWAGGKW